MAAVEGQFGLKCRNESVGSPETMGFALELDQFDIVPILAERPGHGSSLLGWHHWIVKTLKEERCPTHRRGLRHWRPINVSLPCLREGAHEAVEIARFEIVRALDKGEEISDSIPRDCGRKEVCCQA